jgi:hypothetical protein
VTGSATGEGQRRQTWENFLNRGLAYGRAGKVGVRTRTREGVHMVHEQKGLPIHQLEMQDNDGDWWDAVQVLGLVTGWIGGVPRSLVSFTSRGTGEVLRGRVPGAGPASEEAFRNALGAAKQLTESATPDAITTLRLVDAEPEDAASLLYHPRRNQLASQASFWVPAVEAELLEYFGRHPEQLHALEARRFEELVAAIFRGQGFDVELTPPTRDGGFDVLAVRKDVFTGDHTYLVECKRHASDNPVRVGVVRELLGVTTDKKATRGIVVTTSYFTRPARQLEEANLLRLALRDYNALVAWLRRGHIA